MAYTLDSSLSVIIKRGAVSIASEAEAVSAEAHDAVVTQFIEIADDTVDFAIPMSFITKVEALLLLSDQVLSFKLNASTVAITGKTLFLRSTDITAIKVSNASGAKAVVRVILIGD